MKNQKVLTTGSRVFIGFSALSLLYVSMLSMFDPQATMDLVKVELSNNDAISSIRGIYGGVGLTIVSLLIYLMIKDAVMGVRFLTAFWGLYAFSRFITIMVDGALGDFGNQWIVLETVFFLISGLLTFLTLKK